MPIVEFETVRPFKLRLPDDLRRSIDEAAAAAGESVNGHLVRRLRASYREQDALDLMTADHALRSVAITMMAAFRRGAKEAAAAQGCPDMPPHEWIDTPVVYRAGARAVRQVLGGDE